MKTRNKLAVLTISLLSLVGLMASGSAQASVRTYPTHTGIFSTTFWVGEVFQATSDGSQVCSTYDSNWAKNWSGKASLGGNKASGCNGSPVGGCDGKPSGTTVAAFKCTTEKRTAANGYFPTSSAVTPKENPFYLDLPYDDLNSAAGYKARATTIPWANDSGFAGNATNKSFSYMKNRWVKLSKGAATCYAQIQDAGPADEENGSPNYADSAYVFGANDARPANKSYNKAGTDVSPAVNGCLSYAELDGESDQVNWSFVDASDVPAGPWTKVVTTSQVDGAVPSAAYVAAITPSGVVAPPVSTPPATTPPVVTPPPATTPLVTTPPVTTPPACR